MQALLERLRSKAKLRSSVVVQLNVLIFVLGFLGVCFLISNLYLNLKKTYLEEMKQRAEVLATISQLSLIDPLWDFDLEGVKDISKALLEENSLVLVSVKDISGRINVLQTASGVEQTTTDRFDPEAYFEVRRDIFQGEEKLGTLILIWSKQPTLDLIFAISQRLGVAGFLLILILSFSIAWAADHLISRPILKLREETEDVRAGNLLAAIDISRNDELGQLARDFAHMRDSVREKQEHQLELNRRLSEQISLVQKAEELARENYENLRQEVEVRQKLESTNSQLQAEIIIATEQLVQAEKMVLLGTLVASVAHDLANPTQLIYQLESQLKTQLAGIWQRLSALLADNDDEEARLVKAVFQRDFDEAFVMLGEVRIGAATINGIQGAIRNQSRTDSDQEQFDVDLLLEECLIILKSKLAPWQLSIMAEENMQALCRRSQLGQILMNLLSNAIDAISEIADEVQALPVHLILRMYRDLDQSQGVFTVIELEDCGPGIPIEQREKVFQAFYTTKPLGVGTGLGLAICKRIIEQCQGSLTIIDASQLNGACFRIRLPSAPFHSKSI